LEIKEITTHSETIYNGKIITVKKDTVTLPDGNIALREVVEHPGGVGVLPMDENGFIFHTASTKDVFRQMKENPKAEMCFSCGGTQIRVTGVMEQVFDEELRAEIFAHPSRKFLQAWVANGIDNLLQVLGMLQAPEIRMTWSNEQKEGLVWLFDFCESIDIDSWKPIAFPFLK
jgi:uncharacterized pyridoxamine 5'-phosphate oxidase family protein